MACVLFLVQAGVALTPNYSKWNTAACIHLPISFNNEHKNIFNVITAANIIIVFFIVSFEFATRFMMNRTLFVWFLDKEMSNKVILIRRCTSLILTFLLTWVTIGLISVWSWLGMSVPNGLNLVLITIVLPINAVVHPFLYYRSVALEDKRVTKLRLVYKRLEARLRNEQRYRS